MNKNVFYQCVIVLFSCGLAACVTTNDGLDAGVGEAPRRGTDCISQVSIRDYYVLDEANLIVTGSPKRRYHVTLVNRAFGLRSSWRIGFRSPTGQICPGSSDLIVADGLGAGERIRVRSIRVLTPEEHEDLLVRFGKKEPEVPRTLEPADVSGAEVEELD
jgi:hypothetical protein